MTEVARIGMRVTQAAAAVPAMLACEFGAKVSNCVCQVTHFHDFAMGGVGASVRFMNNARQVNSGGRTRDGAS